MTRINCIPVSELTDKHLIAEYRELPRVFKLARVCPEAPKEYTMGAGHVKFFYDKLIWCVYRQHQLVSEMIERGFKPNFVPSELWKFAEHNGGPVKRELWNYWQPTKQAQEINRARINERLNKG